jgi:lysyl-tRNA synthetase class 2
MSSSTALLVEQALQSPTPTGQIHLLGRVHTIRRHGGLVFIDLLQGGHQIQVAFRAQHVPFPDAPLGAWMHVCGELSPSRSGELTLWAQSCEIAQTPLRPLEEQPLDARIPPEQHLLLDPARLLRARQRSALVRSLREALWGDEFEETETPILHRSASGAAARPFQCHSRALETTLSLRVAPEPHLIRLMSAGFPRIFEIARAFRNEGLSRRHQPEFTLMEVYEAGASLSRSIEQCTQLIHRALEASHTPIDQAPFGEHILDWRSPHIVSLRALVEERTQCQSAQQCQAWLQARHHEVPAVLEEAWSSVFEHGIERELIQPTFVVEWPSSISPLAYSEDEAWATRFELFAGGMEIANGFEQNRSEPVQRARFLQQSQRAGEEDVMQADEEYLFAMGWGLPPIGGFGIGIDRLVMLAQNTPQIQDVVLFPM